MWITFVIKRKVRYAHPYSSHSGLPPKCSGLGFAPPTEPLQACLQKKYSFRKTRAIPYWATI